MIKDQPTVSDSLLSFMTAGYCALVITMTILFLSTFFKALMQKNSFSYCSYCHIGLQVVLRWGKKAFPEY